MTTTTTPGGVMTEQPAPRPYLLSDLRRAAGLTQEQVADLMGVTKKRVNQIEASYPGVRYDTLVRYLKAMGGHMQVTVKGLRVNIDEIDADPGLEATREWLRSSQKRGVQRMKTGGSAEELVLQGQQTDPGGDDTGGQVDQPDSQSDQGDSSQGEEPGAQG